MKRLAEQLRQRTGVTVIVEGIDLSEAGAARELKYIDDRASLLES
jgi:hypothetical protein